MFRARANLLSKPVNVKKKIIVSGSSDQLINYFFILLNRHRKTVCSPSIFGSSMNLSDKSIKVRRDGSVYTNITKTQMQTCMNSKKRYILIFVELPGHANAIIYDKQKNELEWFEPHGLVYEWAIPNVLKLLNEKFGLSVEDVISSHSCPRPSGIQMLEKKNKEFLNQVLVEYANMFNKSAGVKPIKGLCFYWTLWYLDMKFSNPTMNSRAVLNKMIKNQKQNFYEFIRDYVIAQRSIQLGTTAQNIKEQLLKKYTSTTISNIKKVVDAVNISNIKTVSDVKKLMRQTGLSIGEMTNSINININHKKDWKLYHTFIDYLSSKLRGLKVDIGQLYKKAPTTYNRWQERMINLNNALIINKLNNKNIPKINNLKNLSSYTKLDLAKILAYNNVLSRPPNPFETYEMNVNSFLQYNKSELQNIILGKKNSIKGIYLNNNSSLTRR